MCSPEHHAHLSAHEWHTLIPLGTMAGLDLANCPDCPEGERFTFSRPLPIVRFWLNRLSDVVRVEYADSHMTVLDGDDEEVSALLEAALAGDADERYCGVDASESKAWAACHEAHEGRSAA